MPLLVVQQGHCFRTTGKVGTVGEQEYAVRVANACANLLGGRAGWEVNRTLADENDYRGDAFVAIHCDGGVPASHGASVGYRTPEGQAFAQAWKRAYAARGWTRGFRADNNTENLAEYYGVRNAVGKGNRRAFIAECGFRTNRDDLALLDGPGGPERVALAIGEALGIPVPPPQVRKRKAEEDMSLRLVRGNSTQQVPGKPFKFGDLRFYVEQDPRQPKKALRWYTPDTPAQRILEKCQGGVDVVEQKDLDAIPFGPGGEIPPDVL